MAGRNIPLVTEQYYHVFNRGVSKRPMFLNKRDYTQALLALSYYRFKNPPVKLSRFKKFPKSEREKILRKMQRENILLVEIVSFVLMPNHFHFLLKQQADRGISKFISKFTNSYTKYFNKKKENVGPLFQGVFKAVRVATNKQLIHLSRYIHLNPFVSYVVKKKDLLSYSWSSLFYILRDDASIIQPDIFLSNFSSIDNYKRFVLNYADYAKEIENIKHLVLEK